MTYRRLSRLAACAGALFLLTATVPAEATDPCGTWSNPPTTGNNVKNGDTYHPTLSAAVAAANAGDTLEVVVQTLTVGPVTIDKNLTIKGTQSLRQTPFLYAAMDTCSSGDAKGWFVVESGVDLTVSNLQFFGNGRQIWEGFRHQGTGSFDSVNFAHIGYNPSGPDFEGTAIAVFGEGASVDVSNSQFSDIGRAGILYYGAGVTGTVDGITYTGKSYPGGGEYLDYGVDVEAGAVVTIQNSTFQNIYGAATNIQSAAVQATTLNGPGTQVTLTGNNFFGNYIGIAAGYHGDHPDTTVVVAHQNSFRSGQHAALMANTNQPIDATGNFWGCTDGPGNPCQAIDGPYADQVQTGFNSSIRWNYSAGYMGFSLGQILFATAQFTPAPADGTMATFNATHATLALETVPIVDGKAGVTLVVTTESDRGEPVYDHPATLVNLGVSAGDLSEQLTILAAGSTRYFSLQTPQQGASGHYTATATGWSGSMELWGSTSKGYTPDAAAGNRFYSLSLDSPTLLDSVSGTENFQFQLPSDWSGQTVYLQATAGSQVSQVLELSN